VIPKSERNSPGTNGRQEDRPEIFRAPHLIFGGGPVWQLSIPTFEGLLGSLE
jgi:hypothetical protein